jgi:hypothetical protein
MSSCRRKRKEKKKTISPSGGGNKGGSGAAGKPNAPNPKADQKAKEEPDKNQCAGCKFSRGKHKFSCKHATEEDKKRAAEKAKVRSGGATVNSLGMDSEKVDDPVELDDEVWGVKKTAFQPNKSYLTLDPREKSDLRLTTVLQRLFFRCNWSKIWVLRMHSRRLT